MSEVVSILYTPQATDILISLNEEADYQRDGSSGATSDEIADLFGEAAEEIQRLREQLGRAELSYRQCDSDRRDFAEECRVLRQERDESRLEAQRPRLSIDPVERIAQCERIIEEARALVNAPDTTGPTA